MAKNIFVVCEQRDNKIQNVSLELLGVANELAAVTKEKVCAVVLGDKIKEAAKELAGYGADIIYVVEDKELKYYLTEQYSQAVYQVLKTYEPNIVLYGATSIGRDLAPRLSARLRTGLTADCTKLEADEQGNLYMTRPAFGGNLFATIVCPDHRPQMSTVRGGVMKKREFDAGRKAEMVEVKVNWDKSRFAVSVVEEVLAEKSAESIDDAKFLVSCGRGVKTISKRSPPLPRASEPRQVPAARWWTRDSCLPKSRSVRRAKPCVRRCIWLWVFRARYSTLRVWRSPNLSLQ